MVHPTGSHRVSRWQLSLHRPLTSERAIRAGPISDVPYVCNNGRDGAVDGRQPFLPVGVPAVNSGSVAGATSLSGAVAASRSRWACSAVWELAVARVRAARSRSPAAARAPGSSGMLRSYVWNRLTAVRRASAACNGGFSTSVCTWATIMLSRAPTTRHRLNPRRIGTRSLLDGPGVSPFRIRGLTAVRGFRAWVARESLRWGGCRLGCLVLPPWD